MDTPESALSSTFAQASEDFVHPNTPVYEWFGVPGVSKNAVPVSLGVNANSEEQAPPGLTPSPAYERSGRSFGASRGRTRDRAGRSVSVDRRSIAVGFVSVRAHADNGCSASVQSEAVRLRTVPRRRARPPAIPVTPPRRSSPETKRSERACETQEPAPKVHAS